MIYVIETKNIQSQRHQSEKIKKSNVAEAKENKRGIANINSG